MLRLARFIAVATPAALTLLSWSCSTGGQPPTLIMNLEDARVTEFQLRILTTDYARRFVGTVDAASREIVDQTDDPAVRRAARHWKSNAVSAIQSALLKTDPLASMLDMWALTEQMARFMDSGAGVQIFGDRQPIAIEASTKLEDEITTLAATMGGERDVEAMRATVESWVANHSIDDLDFTRQYPRELVERVQGGQRLGAFAAVESLDQRLEIYGQFLPLMVELLPKQIRWETKLLVEDYISREEVERAEEEFTEIGDVLERVHQELDELPLLLNAQRDAAVQAARIELDRLIAEVDVQRIATLDAIDVQRVETMEVARDVLGEEREIALSTIEDLRRETLAELPAVFRESVEEMSPSLQALADRLFWRAAILCGALGALLLLAMIVIHRVDQRRGLAPVER